jgi:hypothetical protein
MIEYVRENLSEVEYDLFLDLLAPEPEVVKPVKKARKSERLSQPISNPSPVQFNECRRGRWMLLITMKMDHAARI